MIESTIVKFYEFGACADKSGLFEGAIGERAATETAVVDGAVFERHSLNESVKHGRAKVKFPGDRSVVAEQPIENSSVLHAQRVA